MESLVGLHVKATTKGLFVMAAIHAYEALEKQTDPDLRAKGERLREAVEAWWDEDCA